MLCFIPRLYIVCISGHSLVSDVGKCCEPSSREVNWFDSWDSYKVCGVLLTPYTPLFRVHSSQQCPRNRSLAVVVPSYQHILLPCTRRVSPGVLWKQVWLTSLHVPPTTVLSSSNPSSSIVYDGNNHSYLRTCSVPCHCCVR